MAYRSYDVICTYSQKRATKDKHELDKQLTKANQLITRKEAGKRAKFIDNNRTFILDEELKNKAEQLNQGICYQHSRNHFLKPINYFVLSGTLACWVVIRNVKNRSQDTTDILLQT